MEERMTARNLQSIEGLGNPEWYSSVCRHGDLIWTAGQLPTAADHSVPEDFESQVNLVIDNLEKVLHSAGGGLDTLVKVNTYLASLDDFDAYNSVYTHRLAGFGLPPRTSVAIAGFRPPIRIEIEAVAHAAVSVEIPL
jgi:2-iminobutanoate/2-iminopropanoate deaminase